MLLTPVLWPDQLEVARHDVHLDKGILERADQGEHTLVRAARESDDHALDVEGPNDRRQPLGWAKDRQLAHRRAPAAWARCRRSRRR